MAKVSRPVIYLLVAGVAAYAVVLLTEPEAAKKKVAASTVGRANVTAPPGFTEADMTVKFDRYSGPLVDAFKPKVAAKKPTPAPTLPVTQSPVAMGIWTLTGVTLTDGERSALVENTASGETVFLKVGDLWSGLKVVGVEPTEVVFVNAEGKRMRLAFAVNAEEKPTPAPSGVRPVILPAPGATSAPVAASPAPVAPAPRSN